MIKKINIALLRLVFAMIPFWMLATSLVSFGSLDASHIDLAFQNIYSIYIRQFINLIMFVIVLITLIDCILLRNKISLKKYQEDICLFLDFVFDNLIFFVIGSVIFAMSWFVFHNNAVNSLHIFEEVVVEVFMYALLFKAIKVFIVKAIPYISSHNSIEE